MNKALLFAAFVAVAATSADALPLAQWNFNGTSSATIPGGSTSPTPSVRVGTASLIGGATASFASGTVNSGSSDPVTASPPNFAWNTTTYPAAGTGSGTRGVQFNVSTVGWWQVKVRFDVRHSNTSSRWLRFDYSTDGTNWVLGTAGANRIWAGTAGDTWFNNRTVDLSSVTAANNNANFRFRVVAIFGPASGPFSDTSTYTNYAAASSTHSYGTSGTLRYDMVTVEAVPEPATFAALGLGVAALIRRRAARN